MSRAGSRSSSSNHRSTRSAVSPAGRPVASAWALRSSAIPAASRGVGARTESSDGCTQLLLPDVCLPEDVHAGPLVETRGAGGVLHVDAERDRRFSGLAEAAERVVEQREAEPAPAPRRPDAERPDETPVAMTLRVVRRERDDLVNRPDDGCESGVEPALAERPLAPRVVIEHDVVPLVRECLDLRGVEHRPVAVRLERSQLHAVRPDGIGLRLGDVDDHAEEAPRVLEASADEEPGRPVVAHEMRRLEDDPLAGRPLGPQLEHPLLERREETRADASAGELGMDVRVAEVAAALLVVEMSDAGNPAVDLDEPRVPLDVEPLPLLAELLGR